MNWSFGYSLGRTEFDGQIYGAASAAADCMKALIPFFFFAAVRNKMWSQAAASVIVWVVVTSYSMTSALGHAALNRFDTTGHRAQTAQSYQDLRSELKRAEEKSGWIPQHRPHETVVSEIDALKTQRGWKWSKECTAATTKTERAFCQQYHELNAELAAASEGKAADQRIAEIRAKLEAQQGNTVMTEADPQAKVLTDLAMVFFPSVKIENVQMALTVFVALLLEIGSGFGMYVAFSQWRLYDRQAPAAPPMVAAIENTAAAAVAVPALTPVAVQVKKPRSGANDNRTIEKPQEKVIENATAEVRVAAPARLVAPETDVERFYKENIEVQDGSSVTATQLYEDYCSWCETKSKEPLALPSFGREFAELGVKKERIAGRVRYIGIGLMSDTGREEAMKPPVFRADAA
ncbi:MAG: hypothetical protein ACRCS9_14065 [Hyphomicrobium sp.]